MNQTIKHVTAVVVDAIVVAVAANAVVAVVAVTMACSCWFTVALCISGLQLDYDTEFVNEMMTCPIHSRMHPHIDMHQLSQFYWIKALQNSIGSTVAVHN